MKSLVIALSLTGSIFIAACEKKDTEEYNIIRKELASFNEQWFVSQENLRSSMDNLSSELQNYGKFELKLSELKTINNPRSKYFNVYREIKIYHDSLRVEMENLNHYIHDWNAQATALGELVTLVESEEIAPEMARTQISELKKFKIEADARLKEIDTHTKAYHQKYQELTKH